MAQPGADFAQLLTDGIHQISRRRGKTIQFIQDELGYELGRKGGSAIEYWRKGNLPPKLSDVEKLGQWVVERGQLDRAWLEQFLLAGNHPAPSVLIDQLFPPQDENLARLEKLYSSAVTLDDLPLDYVPELAALPPGSLMPFHRNPLFVGRQSDLQRLAQILKANGAAAVGQIETAATTGLGGIGKTQLASEFVHRYGQYFSGGVFWLDFAEAKSVPSQVAACGGPAALNLALDFNSRPLNEQTDLVRAAWQSPVPRLLIFDNCEDLDLLRDWRPVTGGCRVLITSRRGDWGTVLDITPLAIGVLSRAESIALLRGHRFEAEEAMLDQIAEELGDLPLALHLAGSYLDRYRRSVDPADYLAQLRDPALLNHPSLTGAALDPKRDRSPTDHVHHVGRTFALSYERLDPNDPNDVLTRSLLVRTAHFAPGLPIWYELLVKTLGFDPKDQTEAMAAEQAFARLIELGMIETEEDDSLRMHRLVAAFIREVVSDEVAATQAEVEAIVYEETASLNQAGYPLHLLAHQSHLRSIVDVAQAREDAQSARLCNELGRHLWQIGDYDGAFPYYHKALTIRLALFGENHEETAQSLNNMGYLLRSQGKLPEARPYFERALAVRETILGQNHADTAESLNDLGRWFYENGELDEAKPYFERALAISEQVLGEVHELTAEYVNNIGMCLYEIDDLEGALTHLIRALKINESLLGENHPDIAMNANNVGLLLRSLGQFDMARPYLARALEIRQNVLGTDHPDTGQSFNNFGVLLRDLGEFCEAQAHCEEALAIYRRTLREDHPQLAFCFNALGLVLYDQHYSDQAKPYLEKALAIRQKALETDHPLIALSQHNLGLLFIQLGDYNQAIDCFTSAQNIRCSTFGENHPLTVESKERLAHCQKMINRIDDEQDEPNS